MISGIGSDIVQVERMRELLSRHGKRIVRKIFTAREISDASKRADREVFLSGRWAAKEAVSKALKCGIGKDCAWRDISVSNDSGGAPSARLSGRALALARRKKISNIQLSISHEKDYAVAFVVMETEKCSQE